MFVYSSRRVKTHYFKFSLAIIPNNLYSFTVLYNYKVQNEMNQFTTEVYLLLVVSNLQIFFIKPLKTVRNTKRSL